MDPKSPFSEKPNVKTKKTKKAKNTKNTSFQKPPQADSLDHLQPYHSKAPYEKQYENWSGGPKTLRIKGPLGKTI